ncbi:MAG: hypothetical protein PHW72_00660 [Candidatus Pacebacteria bacterium]|nr:hypothetical protein [Candidatus Paceibacterota bacterium]
MRKPISPKIIALSFGVFVISFLAVFYVVAWQEPTQAPPSGNTYAPLNVGPETQTKAGSLIINASGTEENALVIGQGKVCIDNDCIESWPEEGGADTTFKMTVSSYCVGNSKFCGQKTASYTCPDGGTAVLVNCPRTLLSGSYANDFYACSCSTNGGTASVKASAIMSQSCPNWYTRAARDECTSYTTSCTNDCTSYGVCELTFKCGVENTVGNYTPESCTFGPTVIRTGAACNSGEDEAYCQQQCSGAGWQNSEVASCNANFPYESCNYWSMYGYGCGVRYDLCSCWDGRCSYRGHQVSCHCWN